MKNTRIPVSVEVREKLKKLGNKGDTYNKIILMLIKFYEENRVREDRYGRNSS